MNTNASYINIHLQYILYDKEMIVKIMKKKVVGINRTTSLG